MTEKRFLDIKRFSDSKTAMLLNGIACAVPFVFEKAFLLTWFCFVPYVLIFMKEKSALKTKQFFLHSLFFGYGFYFVGYSWLCELYPLEYLGIEPSIALPLIVFVVAIVPAIHATLFVLCAAFCRKLSEKAPFWLRLAVFPCVFVLAEYLQSLGTFAFPWCRLFVTQAAVPALLQSASLFGSYFLTYFLLFVNSLLAAAVLLPKFRKRAVTFALALFGINFAFGAIRLAKTERAYARNDAYFGAAVLQGNYPYKYKENDSVQSMAARYLSLCDSALDELEKNADARARAKTLVVLPETAIPVTFYDVDRGYPKLLAAYAEKERISLVVGAFSAEKRTDSTDEDVYGNSVFVFTPDGAMSAPYSKQHLVPFGEYLPYRRFFERFFPALADSAAFGTDLTPGKRPFFWKHLSGRSACRFVMNRCSGSIAVPKSMAVRKSFLFPPTIQRSVLRRLCGIILLKRKCVPSKTTSRCFVRPIPAFPRSLPQTAALSRRLVRMRPVILPAFCHTEQVRRFTARSATAFCICLPFC